MLHIALEYIRNQNANEAFANHVDMAVRREMEASGHSGYSVEESEASDPDQEASDTRPGGEGLEEESEMKRYAVRVDMVVEAESQPRANDFMSELLNQAIGLVDEPRIYDWAYGSSGTKKYQSPALFDDNPFPYFTAGEKG